LECSRLCGIDRGLHTLRLVIVMARTGWRKRLHVHASVRIRTGFEGSFEVRVIGDPSTVGRECRADGLYRPDISGHVWGVPGAVCGRRRRLDRITGRKVPP